MFQKLLRNNPGVPLVGQHRILILIVFYTLLVMTKYQICPGAFDSCPFSEFALNIYSPSRFPKSAFISINYSKWYFSPLFPFLSFYCHQSTVTKVFLLYFLLIFLYHPQDRQMWILQAFPECRYCLMLRTDKAWSDFALRKITGDTPSCLVARENGKRVEYSQIA